MPLYPRRTSASLSTLVKPLLFTGALGFVLLPWAKRGADVLGERWRDLQVASRFPTFAQYYAQAKQRLALGDHIGALGALDSAIAAAAADVPSRHVATAHAMKAECHWQLVQPLAAEAALERALQLADGELRVEVRRRLTAVRNTIAVREAKRLDRDTYIAAPNLGPTKRPEGRIVLAYVFIDDGGLSQWSQRSRQEVLRRLSEAEAWYRRQGQGYGVANIEFTRRIFVYDKDPLLRNAFQELVRRDVRTGYDVAARFATLQGAESVNEFLTRLMQEEGTNQAILFLHVNHTARSYALRCMFRCWSDAEYAFLYRAAHRRDFATLSYAQAHEGLHLFGAADLYTQTASPDYAAHDVMNYRPGELEKMGVDSITAYAVGWIDAVPAAPFPVENAGPPDSGVRR